MTRFSFHVVQWNLLFFLHSFQPELLPLFSNSEIPLCLFFQALEISMCLQVQFDWESEYMDSVAGWQER